MYTLTKICYLLYNTYSWDKTVTSTGHTKISSVLKIIFDGIWVCSWTILNDIFLFELITFNRIKIFHFPNVQILHFFRLLSYSHNFFCAVCRSNGGNRFGWGGEGGAKCEFRCTQNGDPAGQCHGNLYCSPDPYGCSCDVGVKGLDCYTCKLIQNIMYIHV